MWHASVAGQVTDTRRRTQALKALEGVGSVILGEWHEARPGAYHVRRRLTLEEQGEMTMRDIRNTPEAIQRLREMGDDTHPEIKRAACEELGLLRWPSQRV